MNIVRKTSILEKIQKIHEHQSKNSIAKIQNFSVAETYEKAVKPDLERMTYTVASEFKQTLGLA